MTRRGRPVGGARRASRQLGRLAGAAAVAGALSVPCGLALTAEPPLAVLPRAQARGPARPQARPARPPARPQAPAAPAPAPPPAATPEHPLDLARALPEPGAASRLAAMLEEPDEAAAVAEALSTTPEGRPLLVAHLSRSVEAPGLDHVAVLEALSQVGREEDLPAVLTWARGDDAVAPVAAWCARAICERERIDAPDDLPDADEAAETPRGDPGPPDGLSDAPVHDP